MQSSAAPDTPAALLEKLTHARARLLLQQPFLGYLVSNLDDRVLDGVTSTVSTDGLHVTWSPAFLARLSLEDAVFVLAHEALHCALQHPWRRKGRNRARWNVACDAVVNDALFETGMRTTRPAFRGAFGRAAEAVYADASASLDEGGPGSLLDDHDPWEDDGEGLRDPRARAASDRWKAALAQARAFGRVPDGIAHHAVRLLEPRRDWRDLLLSGLSFPEDYRWTPTDRRFRDVLLPTLTGEIHRVVLAVDVSGSVVGLHLDALWTELNAILRNNRCEARVLACDAEIRREWRDGRFDPSDVKVLGGGGGTSFVPVFDRLAGYSAEGWVPEALVYLTDLDGAFPPSPPDGPVRVLWVVPRAVRPPPFGDLIVLDDA